MSTLGCADGYIIGFSTKDGKNIGETDRASTVNWNRRLDDYSSSNIALDLGANTDSRACCDLLNKIDVRKDYMNIYRNMGSRSDLVWTGPIQRITSTRSGAAIDAVDKLALYQNRILRFNHDHVGADLGTIWNDYITDANSVDPIITDLCPLTGIIMDRTTNASETRISWGELKELLDTGLDVTIHRGTIVYGAKDILLQRQALRDDHFVGEISVIQDASRAGSQVYVKGEADERVDYPNPSSTPNVGYYGLLERVYNESNLSGTPGLTESAQSHYNLIANQKPYFLDMSSGSSLASSAPVDINDLVCGTLFNISIQDICPPMEQPLRMYQVDVSMSDNELVTIALQPVGSFTEDQP